MSASPTTTGPRDARRVRHRAPAGAPRAAAGHEPRAVVVGGGVAGLAAATGLAERGVRVTLLEREPYLGGRVGGWTDRTAGAALAMSRGFHAFFRQYYNLRALLRRADPDLARLVPVSDYPLVDADGHRDTFRGLPRTPPWNALAFAARSPTFGWRDLLGLDARAAAVLADVRVPEVYRRLDDLDADSFLRAVNFPAAARHLAFEVFSRSFFADPARLSAAELATMFHLYFLGSSEGLLFDVPDAGYQDSLWSPLAGYLADRGVTLCTATAAESVTRTPAGFAVRDDRGATHPADAVVLAADIAGLRHVLAGSPGLGDPGWRAGIDGLRTAPPFLVQRLWLDRPVAEDRPAFLATGGMDPLDNVSVLGRYDRDAVRHGGAVVELHAYARPEPAAADVDSAPLRDLRARLRDRLAQVYPETADAVVCHERVLWRADCPLFATGGFATRPPVRTPVDGLVLAGDAVRVDLPVALMERAATTGWHAANVLLARWGLAGHPLETVPTRGRLAPLRALAAAARRGRTRPCPTGR